MPKTNTTDVVHHATFFGYVASQSDLLGTGGFVSWYLESQLPARHIVLNPDADRLIHDLVRTLPWRDIGLLVSGLSLSPPGDWLECRISHVPYGVLAWPVGDAIKVRGVRGMELGIPLRDCVLIAPANRTPIPPEDVADPNDAWPSWLNQNIIVLPAQHPGNPEPDDVLEQCWCLAVGDLAHMAFLKDARKRGS